MRVTHSRLRTVALRGGALAAAATLLLSGCGGTAPGVAAEVAGERITDEQVDDFAEVLCALGGLPGTEAGTPTSAARYNALQILLATELAQQVGDTDAIDEKALAAAQAQMAAGGDQLPEDSRGTFEQVATDYLRSQYALIALGRASLAEQGRPATETSEDQAYAEGERLMREFAEEADVEVDPRYGRFEDGVLVPDSGSLSVPVSDFARSAAEEQPTDELVGALPASQKCG